MNLFFGRISKKISSFSKKFFIFSMIFSMSLVNFSNVFALEGAKWGGTDKNSIIYNGKTYTKSSDTSKLPSNLKSGTAYISTSNASADGSQKAEAIIVNSTDSNKIEGKLYNFEVSAAGNYKQSGEGQDISGEGVSDGSESSSKSDNSCKIEGGGGWIVCTLANTIAGAMDGLYDILKGFLQTQPLQVSSKSGLFVVWDYMRNIANVLFVILFMIVIYSQITNFGISNYGIKKMLPKLIIAAVLINISYYICAIFIDLSNITGAQLQNLLVGVRKDVVAQGFNTEVNWAGLVTAVLAGGSYAGYAFVTQIGTLQGLGFAVLGILLVVIYSVFVAVVVLAARQAIITVLVFLSPLAFAANILPNTEKWYSKWKDLLTTMLVMYPLMALLFGGSQLAGTVIIANSNGNVITLILGMAVQVVPLAITPTIIKLSQGLLGRFAGMINNPNKGPIDTARNWAKRGQEDEVNKQIAKGGKFNLTAITAGYSYGRNSRHANNKSIAENYQKARFNNKNAAEIEKATAMEEGARRDAILSNNTAYQLELSKLNLEQSEEFGKKAITGLKAEIAKSTFEFDAKGKIIGIDDDKVKALGSTSRQLYDVMNNLNATKSAVANNNSMITNNIAETMKRDQNLQSIAAGQRGEVGKTIALSQAFTAAQKQSKEEVDAVSNLVKQLNLGDKEREKIFDKDSTVIEKDGVKLEINDTLRKATIDEHMGTLDAMKSLELLGKTSQGDYLYDVRGAIVDSWKKNKKDDAQTMPGSFLGKLAQSGGDLDEVLNRFRTSSLSKISDETITKMSDDFAKILFDKSQLSTYSHDQLSKIANTFKSIDSNKDMYSKVGANRGDVFHETLAEIKRIDPSAAKDITLENIKKN